MRTSPLNQAVLLILCSLISATYSWQLQAVTRRATTPTVTTTSPRSHQQQSFPTTRSNTLTMTDSGTVPMKEAWTKPRLHNTAEFRGLAILAAVAAAGLSSNSPFQMLSAQSMAALHLFSFATWFGTMVYTTFILGITMFRNLPRKTFGKLQAKLFPMYFSLSSVAIVLQIVTLKGLTSSVAVSTVAKSTKSLLVALVMTLLNQFIIEPMTTKNMMRRYDLEEIDKGVQSDEYKTLKSNFGKFHGISSLTNLVALCAAAAHGFYLSATLV